MDQMIDDIVQDWILDAPFPDIHNILFSSDSSSSESSEDDEGINRIRVPRRCVRNFVENTVRQYNEKQFRKHFRLRRSTLYQLIERFEQTNFFQNLPIGGITHERALLMTVWYLANIETFREISNLFDFAPSDSHRVLLCSLDFLISLSEEYIRWPETAADKIEVSRKFSDLQNITQIIGAIDGCHVRIRRPVHHQEDYYNRKRYHSIILQAVANSDKVFTDVYIGEPGSMHDARVFRRSPLYEKALTDPNFFGTYFLLGDTAYPSTPWMITPFRDNGHLTPGQRQFNYRHSSTRIVIEQAFGLLRARFRRLIRFDNLRVDIIVKCVMASCILHNICILHDDPIEDDTSDSEISDESNGGSSESSETSSESHERM
ncbi:putative nuclease HARBI1 [Chelonus insularis]|uniref:putative nuclease HARBI1 n=2 Tax=Chelonus insularis TaxID=460826 RepID=UPI00158BED8A|nr:putative nuclease HARBI1 [Chelonus insularis]